MAIAMIKLGLDPIRANKEDILKARDALIEPKINNKKLCRR